MTENSQKQEEEWVFLLFFASPHHDSLTDDGWLHRAVDVDGETHIIEELQLFDKPQPIESMVISTAQVCIHGCTWVG